jgi:hypothetical protein
VGEGHESDEDTENAEFEDGLLSCAFIGNVEFTSLVILVLGRSRQLQLMCVYSVCPKITYTRHRLMDAGRASRFYNFTITHFAFSLVCFCSHFGLVLLQVGFLLTKNECGFQQQGKLGLFSDAI